MSGHRKSFKCGHRGFGVTCHRCEQGTEMGSHAKQLGDLLKAGKPGSLPKQVEVQKDQVTIRSGGHKFSGSLEKKTLELVLGQLVEAMRLKSTALLNEGRI